MLCFMDETDQNGAGKSVLTSHLCPVHQSTTKHLEMLNACYADKVEPGYLSHVGLFRRTRNSPCVLLLNVECY